MSSLSSTPNTNLAKDLATHLIEVIPRAMREIRASNRSYKGTQLSLPQFRVLANIWRLPKTNKQLAEDIGLSVAAMSRIVDALEKQKLVSRKTDNVDRRVSNISITKEGLQLFTSIRSKTCNKIADQLLLLSHKELVDLQNGLTVIENTMLRNST